MDFNRITTDSKGAAPAITFEKVSSLGETEVFRLTATYSEETIPEQFSITWFEDNGGVYSFWAPQHASHRAIFPSWTNKHSVNSVSSDGMPLFQYLNKQSENVFTVAIGDVINPIRIDGGIDERSGKLRIKLHFFTEQTKPVSLYQTLIYCNRERRFYTEVLSSVRSFWAELGFRAAYAPVQAERCHLSSWYTFQKDVSADALYRQCVLAKEYGMDALILDDGWQVPGGAGLGGEVLPHHYGDWEPYTGKFPDMKQFVSDVQKLDMKFILWIATPFISKDCKDFEFLKGMSLHTTDKGICFPDPRYKEVRDWYLRKLTGLMTMWNLDGFKLDFVGLFHRYDDTPRNYHDKMDILSIPEATAAMMTEIKQALSKINPDVMIEYRQSYIGPAMQQSCNMLRVGDHAYGAMFNRINGIDLRLMCQGTPVHSDMLMWDFSATAEEAADQLSNVLFLVPQISMFLDRLPADHRKMLKYYLRFIDENRDTLLHGDLVPLYPEALYPAIYAKKNGTVIAALYSMNAFTVPDGTENLTLVNASGSDTIILSNIPSSATFTIRNCMGEIVETGIPSANIAVFRVPHNGFLFVGK